MKRTRHKRAATPGAAQMTPIQQLAAPPSSLPPTVVESAGPTPALPATDDRVRCPNPHCNILTKRRTCQQCGGKVPQPSWRLPDDCDTRELAMKIIAMRIAGLDDEEIAKQLGLAHRSIRQYVYIASKNGWLTDFSSTKDAIEFGLLPKALKNLHGLLDSEILPVKAKATMELLQGTAFKEFDQKTADQQAPTTVVAIRIERPAAPITVREGTIGGTPGYVEADLVSGASEVVAE